jgi:HTH-type transcriptional regulator, transcriptional repressor of NAD biosynthesis genes
VAFKLGLVVGKFAPLHKGHQLVISTALEQMDHVVVLVYSHPDFSWMPSRVRAQWIRELYPDALVFVPENPPPNDADDWTHREFVKGWLEQNKFKLPPNWKIDTVFGSDDYLEGFAAHSGAKAHRVDAQRSRYPVSGTQVRQALQRMRSQTKFVKGSRGVSLVHEDSNVLPDLQLLTLNFLSGIVRRHLRLWIHPVQKVVFLGAESTGKSTLTERMALEYDTRFVAEFGREVWVQKNGQLELSDYVDIAHRHREMEDAALLESKRFLFVDTNAITTMFLGYAYEGEGASELTALARDAQTRYHHVFLCDTDIPFEQDGWRDNDFWRRRAQGLIRYDLEVRGVPYTLVSGDLEARVATVKSVLANAF